MHALKEGCLFCLFCVVCHSEISQIMLPLVPLEISRRGAQAWFHGVMAYRGKTMDFLVYFGILKLSHVCTQLSTILRHLTHFPPCYPRTSLQLLVGEACHARVATASCSLLSLSLPLNFMKFVHKHRSIALQFPLLSLSAPNLDRIPGFMPMTRALGMAATSVGPALRSVVEVGALRSRSRSSCAVAQSRTSQFSYLCGGGSVSRTSRRRFLLALQGTGGMLGMMSTAPPQARAAGVSEAEEVLLNVKWPEQFPFSKEDFARYDESPDTDFYDAPRFVTHIDDPAIRALTKYYSTALPPSNTPGVAVLDMCSSWISHYPKGYKQERIVGLGLNEAELKKNDVLTEYGVQDLNVNPTLPFADNSFDVITNVVSVDYLNKPLEIFKEMHRVLKPGGLATMSFSNRCFFTKAISIWTSTGDIDHVMIVGSYFHYAGGFEPPRALDISPNPGRSDPMYIVYSRKLNSEATGSA